MKKIDLVERAKSIILQPKQEWELIDREQYEVKDLFTNYVLILAAIPAVVGFVGASIVPLGGYLSSYRIPIPNGIAHMVIDYLFSLGSVYVLAVIIDGFAPTFGGEKNFLQSMKLAVFSSTALWLAGVFFILPAMSILYLLGLYSLYLLYLGLPLLMNVHEDKRVPYFVVIAVLGLVINVVIRAVAALTIPGPVRGF
jgi:hypothetical protein